MEVASLLAVDEVGCCQVSTDRTSHAWPWLRIPLDRPTGHNKMQACAAYPPDIAIMTTAQVYRNGVKASQHLWAPQNVEKTDDVDDGCHGPGATALKVQTWDLFW